MTLLECAAPARELVLCCCIHPQRYRSCKLEQFICSLALLELERHGDVARVRADSCRHRLEGLQQRERELQIQQQHDALMQRCHGHMVGAAAAAAAAAVAAATDAKAAWSSCADHLLHVLWSMHQPQQPALCSSKAASACEASPAACHVHQLVPADQPGAAAAAAAAAATSSGGAPPPAPSCAPPAGPP